ncbi:MAG: dTMP kinase [Kiritimatiellaeota bacterium]|nr:dTMP kinase [Kiritimatiellota bacterium]
MTNTADSTNDRKGVFITFEGPECAGKTTQIALLKRRCDELGRKTLVTREPGGTEIGEALRNIVKHHVGDTAVTDHAELLLFSASRAQHVEKRIIPALEAGYVVICDRFIDSTTAYQGYGRGLDLEFIKTLNAFAVRGCVPDITILLDLSAEESHERGQKREETLFVEDRIESEEIDFHRRVRDGFMKLAELDSERVKVVSAVNSVEKIELEIFRYVAPLIG